MYGGQPGNERKRSNAPTQSGIPTTKAKKPSTQYQKKKPDRLHSPEHANLVHDVIPLAGCLELLRQQPEQFLTHVNDPVGHGADIALPVLEQLGVVQDQRNLKDVSVVAFIIVSGSG
jgi:hypothetical protein